MDCSKIPEIRNFLIQWWHEDKKSPYPLLSDYEAETIDTWLEASKTPPSSESIKIDPTQFPKKGTLAIPDHPDSLPKIETQKAT